MEEDEDKQHTSMDEDKQDDSMDEDKQDDSMEGNDENEFGKEKPNKKAEKLKRL